ncbi:MAG: NAD-dependent DNA ligase LigA [Kiritimatiellae bacterium]|nr:NAD-dependent DNA ligase LigA [Kiritimatiellia bacterium]
MELMEIEMRDIISRLDAASKAYYGGKAELMTDYEWDALFDRLKLLEKESGIVLEGSPTAKVSEANAVQGAKEQHEFAALSLAKTKAVADVAKWAGGRDIWISWKLDGLTLVATYDGGRLVRLLTRGDGKTGTNITHLADAIGNIPKTIAEKGRVVVRGEAVISYADFEAFAASSSEEYANPRNLASGSLALKDIEEIKRRKIQWNAFTLVHAAKEIVSWGERMDWLDELGFKTVERERISSPDRDKIKDCIDRWTDKVQSGKCPFPVDGLVVAYDDSVYAAGGAVTQHHAERAGLAFKWQDETARTTLEAVEWQCAVSCIAPVAVFKPVELEGTLVRRATLHNVSECERLGIGGAGTVIDVIKANKIIPKVVAVERKEGVFSPPETCPVCGAKTEIALAESGTKKLVCTNARCPARELRKFVRFVSKIGMDIDGLAAETLAKFIDAGFVKTFGDVFRLGRHRDEIAAMEGFGAKSADNIVAALANARKRSAAQVLTALSIPQCGREVARKLLGAADGNLRKLLEAADEPDAAERFAAVEDIGPVISEQFVTWCRDEENRVAIDDLLREIEPQDEVAAAVEGTCAGLTFVATGDLAKFKNRAELKKYIESQGGKMASAVSSATDYLVNNNAASQSGKNKKARELGIKILTEDEFIERFGGTV